MAPSALRVRRRALPRIPHAFELNEPFIAVEGTIGFTDTSYRRIFCSVLVSRTPWDAAAIVNQLSRERIHSRAAENFIQELARQAIIAPNSMLGREAGYRGFNVAPVLSNAIFGSDFLRRYYEPLSFFGHGDFDAAESERLSRLRLAVNLQLSLALEQQDYWSDRSLIHLPDFLRSALWRIRNLERTDEKAWRPAHEITHCLTNVIDSIRNALIALRESDKEHDREHYNMLFLREGEDAWRASLLENAAETIAESLFAISNDFSDHDDVFWHLALDVMRHLVPQYGSPPNGVDPFQQRVILKLIQDQGQHDRLLSRRLSASSCGSCTV